MKTFVVADLRHGLALFPGDEVEVEERYGRLRRKCLDLGMDAADFDRDVIVLLCPGDVDERELDWMLSTCTLPRRVVFRMRDR